MRNSVKTQANQFIEISSEFISSEIIALETCGANEILEQNMCQCKKGFGDTDETGQLMCKDIDECKEKIENLYKNIPILVSAQRYYLVVNFLLNIIF